MRLFNEFSENKEGAKLEVYCCALNVGEVEKLISMLEEKGFELIFVDAYSLTAKKEGEYKEVMKVKKELEKEGFRWSLEKGKSKISEK